MAWPEGKYTNVHVVDPLNGTLLTNGTGTQSSYGVFACGNFTAGNYPGIGKLYKINAQKDTVAYEQVIPCITTDHQTCEFKEAKTLVTQPR